MVTSEPTTSPLIKPEESVLVIIDVQERLVPAIFEHEKVVENTRRLLALSKILKLPVLYTEQEKLGPTLPAIKAEIGDREPVSKLSFNCFFSDSFNEQVRATLRNTMIIAGVEAHICVAQTALWAHSRFRVHVVGDAVSSRTAENRHFAIDRMRAQGVTITSTEMVIYELLQRAGTEEFKAMLPLIK